MNYRSKSELADLVEKGLETPGVAEQSLWYLASQGEVCAACALGLAYIGLIGDPKEAENKYWENHSFPGYERLAQLLNISPELGEEVNLQHAGGIPARVIAFNLRKE